MVKSTSSYGFIAALFFVFAFIAWRFSTSPYTADENERWLSLLANGKIDQIWLCGSRSSEFYNTIDTVKIVDKRVISKAIYYLSSNKLASRNSFNFKNQLYTCDAILFSGRKSWKLYLMKLPEGKGLVESLRNDSIYQNNNAIIYLDSIFKINVKKKLAKP